MSHTRPSDMRSCSLYVTVKVMRTFTTLQQSQRLARSVALPTQSQPTHLKISAAKPSNHHATLATSPLLLSRRVLQVRGPIFPRSKLARKTGSLAHLLRWSRACLMRHPRQHRVQRLVQRRSSKTKSRARLGNGRIRTDFLDRGCESCQA